MVLFKDFRNQHYREFIEDNGDMQGVPESLALSIIPHFTTLQKFISRIKTLYLRFTFKKTVNLFYFNDKNIPIGYRLFWIYERVLQPLFFRKNR